MKRYFLTGLATLLPLAVTLYVVEFLVNFLTHPFMHAVMHVLKKSSFLREIPVPVVHFMCQIIILFALFLFILCAGTIARWVWIKSLIWLGEEIFQKIPLLNKVYKTTKDVIEVLFSSKQKSFQQVVMVRFPNKNCYSIGLVVSKAPHDISQAGGEPFISVFLPTTPNPTTGFLIVSPKSELIYLDMKSEEAIKYILSCGVVQPTRKNP